MQILYVILVLCFLALVWAAVSITRHVRAGRNSALPDALVPAALESLPSPRKPPVAAAAESLNPSRKQRA